MAVVSSNSVFCDPDANLKHFEALIKEAAEKGARLVCFPELALMAYSTDRNEKTIVVTITKPLAVLVPPFELRRLRRR